MGKLEQRKFTLDGFSNLMAMFREIESIQEELKEVEVRSMEREKKSVPYIKQCCASVSISGEHRDTCVP